MCIEYIGQRGVIHRVGFSCHHFLIKYLEFLRHLGGRCSTAAQGNNSLVECTNIAAQKNFCISLGINCDENGLQFSGIVS